MKINDFNPLHSLNDIDVKVVINVCAETNHCPYYISIRCALAIPQQFSEDFKDEVRLKRKAGRKVKREAR